ncbi:MAG: hypothetical protein AAGB46_15980 [Verrucomicrobiota bacterium]
MRSALKGLALRTMQSLSLSKKLFLSHFLSIVLVSGTVTAFLFSGAKSNLREQLKLRMESSAALISGYVDARSLDKIVDEKDIVDSGYLEILSDLRAAARSNDDISYIYVMRKVGDEIQFVVDSDESEEQAMPGEAYEEATDDLIMGFKRPSSDKDVTEDRWGVFISGYAPIRNGGGEYMVGIDMFADEFFSKMEMLKWYAWASIPVTLILSWLVSLLLAHHFRKPIDDLAKQAEALRSGDADTIVGVDAGCDLERLVDAMNDISFALTAAKKKSQDLEELLNSSSARED